MWETNWNSHIINSRANITSCNNQFYYILVYCFNADPNLEVLSNLPAFCRSFNFENRTINKHFTFANVCCFGLGLLVPDLFIVIPKLIHVIIQAWVLLWYEMFWLIFHLQVLTKVHVKCLIIDRFSKLKVLQKVDKGKTLGSKEVS